MNVCMSCMYVLPCRGEWDVQRAHLGRYDFLFKTQAALHLQLCGYQEIHRRTANLDVMCCSSNNNKIYLCIYV